MFDIERGDTYFLHTSRKGKALYHAIEEGLKRRADGRTLKF
jgi:hypothetical protein